LRPLVQRWQKPSLVSFHGADVLVDMEKPAYRRATEEMLSLVKRVLVRSDSLRQAVIDLGCATEKVEIQRTGIPPADFPFRERGIPGDGQWRLLQAGRLIEKKGLKTALCAFAKFRKEFPATRLTIAGEGPQLEELQSLARELQLAGAVDFVGFVSQEQLRELFYEAHIFLHPSETGRDGNQEGVPNSMLEAMATGLPVFATRHGGIPEAVENNVFPSRCWLRARQWLVARTHLSANAVQFRPTGRPSVFRHTFLETRSAQSHHHRPRKRSGRGERHLPLVLERGCDRAGK